MSSRGSGDEDQGASGDLGVLSRSLTPCAGNHARSFPALPCKKAREGPGMVTGRASPWAVCQPVVHRPPCAVRTALTTDPPIRPRISLWAVTTRPPWTSGEQGGSKDGRSGARQNGWSFHGPGEDSRLRGQAHQPAPELGSSLYSRFKTPGTPPLSGCCDDPST